MAKVEIRPIDRKTWHGKTGKESFTRPKTFQVLYDEATGGYATGLTKEEAEQYGKALGGVDLSDTFNFEDPHPYWDTKAASFSLPNQTLILDTSKPLDYVRVKNMKASKAVANSMKEYNEGLWPHATHVIFDEQEEVSITASKIQLKNKASEIAFKMSADDKIAVIQVLRNKNLKGRSNDFIDVEMDSILNEQPQDFLDQVKQGKDEIYLRAQVTELIQKGVLTKDGHAILYMGEQIGWDFEATVKYFREPENQRMKIAIFDKLNK